MANTNFVLYEKTYEFILWLFPVVGRFPKNQRFVLAQQIEMCAVRLLLDLVVANQSERKLSTLKSASKELDKLRILVRLAKDLEFLSVRRYGIASGYTNEIGKMLGGWMKSQVK